MTDLLGTGVFRADAASGLAGRRPHRPGAAVCAMIGAYRGTNMLFTIEARNSAGAVSFSCSTASEAVDKVLELERHYGEIAVKDGTGRTIDRDELSALCEAGED